MDIKVNTNISKEFNDITIKVEVNAPELTDDIQKILNNLSRITKWKEEIIATKDNEIFLIKSSEIFYIYSDEKNNFIKTSNGIYKIKDRLYELEDNLDENKFIRISNSCIINIDKTKCFDVGQIGSLFANMEDNTKQEVSKRRIKNVMKFLNERK